MGGHDPVGVRDEVQLMQGGVRDWVQQAARWGTGGLRAASPAVVLSLLCASAFGPLLMVGGVAGAGIGVISSVGGGLLTQVVSDALTRLRQHGQAREPSREELEKGIAQQIQRILAAGDQRAAILRGEIASVLKEIDAGGTALRAAMEESGDRVRSDVIAAIGALGSDFNEMRFLLKDVAQAAAEIQKSLDVQGADVRAIIEQNERQSAEIRLVREDLAVIARQAAAGGPAGAERGDGGSRWVRGCPYRGLLPFDESDAEVFYGRERLAVELAVEMAARVIRGGMVIVTGASGAGKSSLLRAGLLPILARGQQVQGSDQWPRIVMTPTKDPLTELAARLAALGGSNTIAVRDGLAKHPDQAHTSVWPAVLAFTARHGEARTVSAGKTARLVLIVDQFEQVFTLTPGPGAETARQAFVTALCAAATNRVGPAQEPSALVVISVRGDFWDRCLAYPELKGALQDRQFVVGPMTESELRVAITGPADAAGLRIDPALTDTILGDLHAAGSSDTSGVLPLLSQAMSLTWEKREGNRLTSHGYAQTGGVSHAVQTAADKAYDALPAREQALARDVFRSMIVASRDGRLARRPVTRDDLYTALPQAAQPDIDAILDAFAAERLVVLDGDVAQISHDVLLQAWPRLRGWLEEDQANWILYGQLTDAVDAWRDSHHDPSFLYRGTPLTALQQAIPQWSANPGRYPTLTGTQRDFLHASERAVTRSSRQRRGAVAILALLTLAASTASVIAFQARNDAVRQRDQAIYSQVVAEAFQFGTSNTSLAAQLGAAAYQMEPTQDQASRLFSTESTPLASSVTSSGGLVYTVAFSSNGHMLASGNGNGTVRLWNVANPERSRPVGQPLTATSSNSDSLVEAVAFSPNSDTLASGSDDGTVRLWNVANPPHAQPLGQPLTISSYNLVTAVAFSPDGDTLASGNSDGTVRLWNVANPAHPQLFRQPLVCGNIVSAVAFSKKGHILASGNDHGTIRLWNIADPAHPHPMGQPLTGIGNGVDTVAFSPDSHMLASGNADGTISLWNVANPAHPQPLGHPLTSSNYVNSVAFSPDGHTLASGNFDGTVRLWNISDPAQPRPLGQPLTNGSSNAVDAVAFSPDGHTLASGNNDGTILLWHLPLTILTSGFGSPAAVAFSPVGHTLASGNNDGTVQLWNVADPARPRPFGQPLINASAVNAMAFSRDGHILATGDEDGRVRLWNVADPTRPQPFGQPLINSSAVNAMAFSRDDHVLATGDDDGRVRLWNVADPAHPQPFGQPPTSNIGSSVDAVALSPGSDTLASGNQDGIVRLWNVANPAHPRPLGRPLSSGSNNIAAVAFSPDGHTLADASWDGTVRLWNVANPAHSRLLGQPLISVVGGLSVNAVAFSPDGHILASANGDGTVPMWNVANPAHPRLLGQPLTNGNRSNVNAVAFSPNSHTLATGNRDGTVRLWSLNAHDAIERICATTGGLTFRQWHKYISQLQYQPLCVH